MGGEMTGWGKTDWSNLSPGVGGTDRSVFFPGEKTEWGKN